MWHAFEHKALVSNLKLRRPLGRYGRRRLYTTAVNVSEVTCSQATEGTTKRLHIPHGTETPRTASSNDSRWAAHLVVRLPLIEFV